jgi:hypothetical protein
MSAAQKVDVLAWFDDYIRRCGIYDDGTPIRAAVAELIEETKKSVADLRKHAKQVHDLPLLQQDLRRLANRIERRVANVGSAS